MISKPPAKERMSAVTIFVTIIKLSIGKLKRKAPHYKGNVVGLLCLDQEMQL